MLDNFCVEMSDVLVFGFGQVLLCIVWLLFDLYMCGWMSDVLLYVLLVELGQLMVGGMVSCVVLLNLLVFCEGDLVVVGVSWQDYVLFDGCDLILFGCDFVYLLYVFGVFGMLGFIVYMGLLKIGELKVGEIVVVVVVSGVVGVVVGQIVKLKGCCVVGVVGGVDKCVYVIGMFGFDVCVDYYDLVFVVKLKDVCLNGIDVYFENVGGVVFDVVWLLLNDYVCVFVCGIIVYYNDVVYDDKVLLIGCDWVLVLMGVILCKCICVQGFIIFDYYVSGYVLFLKDMSEWVVQGKVKMFEDVVFDFVDVL